jgi:hypothetical protein
VVLSIVPAGLFLAGLAIRAARRRERGAPRRSRDDRLSAIETLRSLDVSAPGARRDAYSRLDALLREHAGARAGIPAAAMTPGEIGSALASRSSAVPQEALVSLLAVCEEARYASPDAVPSEQICRRDIDRAVDLLGPRG